MAMCFVLFFTLMNAIYVFHQIYSIFHLVCIFNAFSNDNKVFLACSWSRNFFGEVAIFFVCFLGEDYAV